MISGSSLSPGSRQGELPLDERKRPIGKPLKPLQDLRSACRVMPPLHSADPGESQRIEQLDGLFAAVGVPARARNVSARVAQRPQPERTPTPWTIGGSADGADLFRGTCYAAESLEEGFRQPLHRGLLSRLTSTYARLEGTALSHTCQCVHIGSSEWAIAVWQGGDAVAHGPGAWDSARTSPSSRYQCGSINATRCSYRLPGPFSA